MTNDTQHPPTDVHVIGGGLGGLTAAAFVARAGHSVTVHESRNRFGGRATTDERNGFRFNQGPHALYLSGEGHRVLTELGLEIAGSPPNPRGGRAVFGGESFLAPGGPWSLLTTKLLGARDKIAAGRLLSRLDNIDPAPLATTTVADWVDAVADRPRVRMLVHTLIRLTTYVNAPTHLSADVAVRQLQMGLGDGVLYLDRGWEQMVDLLAAMPGVTFATGERVAELPDSPAVIVAAGGPAAASGLTGHGYADGIAADVATLDLGLRRPAAHDLVLGVDQPIYLSNHGFMRGMTPPGGHIACLAHYLAPGDQSDRRMLEQFKTHAGISESDVVEERYLHRMSAVTAIPTADGGGMAGRPGVAVPGRPGAFVVGDWVGARGHLLDAVLASAEEAAAAAVAHLARQPVLG